MTALEKFKSTARGLAIGAVLAAALLPVSNAAEPRAGSASGTPFPAAAPEGALPGSVDEQIARFEKRIGILYAAQERLSRENAALARGVEYLADLNVELANIVPDPSRMDPRQYLSVLGQVLEDAAGSLWKARGFEPAPDAPVAVLVSDPSSGGAHDGRVMRLADMQHQARQLAEAINEWSQENERVQALLSRMAAELDTMLRLSRDPGSDLDEAYEAWDRFSDMLLGYLDPPGDSQDVADLAGVAR